MKQDMQAAVDGPLCVGVRQPAVVVFSLFEYVEIVCVEPEVAGARDQPNVIVRVRLPVAFDGGAGLEWLFRPVFLIRRFFAVPDRREPIPVDRFAVVVMPQRPIDYRRI